MIFLLFMNLILKKIYLFKDYKIKCAIGKRGIKSKRKRGINAHQEVVKIKIHFL